MVNYMFPQNTSPRFFEQTPNSFSWWGGQVSGSLIQEDRIKAGFKSYTEWAYTGRNSFEQARSPPGCRSTEQPSSLPPGLWGARSYWSRSLCCTSSPATSADQSGGRWRESLQNREPAKPREWFVGASEWRLRSAECQPLPELMAQLTFQGKFQSVRKHSAS